MMVLSFFSGFQIWKNTKKNKGLLKKWMLVTKLVENAAPLKTTFPYETDSLTKDVVPIFDKVIHYLCFSVLPAFSRLSLEQQQNHQRQQQQQQWPNDHQPMKAQLSFVSYLSLPFSSSIDFFIYQLALNSSEQLLPSSSSRTINESLLPTFDILPSVYQLYVSSLSSVLNVSLPVVNLKNEEFNFSLTASYDNLNVVSISAEFILDQLTKDCLLSFNEVNCWKILVFLRETDKTRRRELQDFHAQSMIKKLLIENPVWAREHFPSSLSLFSCS
jgi:hypothetical protein